MCLPQRSIKFREFSSGSLRIFILMKLELAGRWRIVTNSWQFMEIKYHNSLNSAAICPPQSELYFPSFPLKTGTRTHLISLICLLPLTTWTLDIHNLILRIADMILRILEMLRSSQHITGMSLTEASATVCCKRYHYTHYKSNSRG